jgi:hypothetical protein
LWACFGLCAVLLACADATQPAQDLGQVDGHQVEDLGQVDAQQLDHHQAEDLGQLELGLSEDLGRACSGINPCPWGYVCVARPDDAGQVLTAFCEPFEP